MCLDVLFLNFAKIFTFQWNFCKRPFFFIDRIFGTFYIVEKFSWDHATFLKIV